MYLSLLKVHDAVADYVPAAREGVEQGSEAEKQPVGHIRFLSFQHSPAADSQTNHPAKEELRANTEPEEAPAAQMSLSTQTILLMAYIQSKEHLPKLLLHCYY